MTTSVLNFTLDGVPFIYNRQEIADSTATPWWETNAIRFPSAKQPVDPRILDLMVAMGLHDERITTPVLIASLSIARVIRISGGADHMCAITAEHALYCWGLNSSGQLGARYARFRQ